MLYIECWMCGGNVLEDVDCPNHDAICLLHDVPLSECGGLQEMRQPLRVSDLGVEEIVTRHWGIYEPPITPESIN